MLDSCVETSLYISYFHKLVCCRLEGVPSLSVLLPLSLLSGSLLILQMSTSLQTYIGFADGACHSTWNISSAAWVIYSPTDELVSMHGVSLGQTTNNIIEYNTVIELLYESISFGV